MWCYIFFLVSDALDQQAGFNSCQAFFSLVYHLRLNPGWIAAPGANVIKLSGAPLYGRPLALPTNISLGWRGLTRTNTQAYYENP